ncbi:MAG: hypothetical protein AAF802_03630 [Planctomycetota bacterium]
MKASQAYAKREEVERARLFWFFIKTIILGLLAGGATITWFVI